MTLSDWCAVSKSGGPNHFSVVVIDFVRPEGPNERIRDDQTLVAKIATVAKKYMEVEEN